MDISLNKYISDTGFCSRREADLFIEEGRVTINGRQAVKGNRVRAGDEVHVDGEKLKSKKNTVYIALNKPKGITCTTDQKDKSNVIDFVGYKSRIFPVGRLDKLSEGLLFLTNDGDIVNKILCAGNKHEKEYVVVVDKPFSAAFVQQMSSGVRILGLKTLPCIVKQEGADRFRIVLTQGLNRQIRRMCETLGFTVKSLKRIRIMNITLAGISPGKWRYFTPDEIRQLNELVAFSTKTETSDQSGMDE